MCAAEIDARVIPYGGGTSVVEEPYQSQTGDRPVLTISMRRMNQLTRLDSISLLATFGAGVAGPELEAHLRARGFTLGHFPQSFEFSTLGGWVATRSSGQSLGMVGSRASSPEEPWWPRPAVPLHLPGLGRRPRCAPTWFSAEEGTGGPFDRRDGSHHALAGA